MKYYFEDFTEDNYKNLIRIAKQRFKFVKYSDINLQTTCILWRHDIDSSIHRAKALAKIEIEEGVCSTYFIFMGSFFYNIFEREIREIIKDIKLLGHDLGLHFDASIYQIQDRDSLERWISFEKTILENLFNMEIKVFSYHDPTQEILKFDEFSYANMINTYSKFFRENIGYCSDSNGYWRHERLEDVLNKGQHKKLQVLTHPEWWQERPMSPRDRISRCIDGRAKKQHLLYDKLLEEYERENVGK